jgi:hypothetical protein
MTGFPEWGLFPQPVKTKDAHKPSGPPGVGARRWIQGRDRPRNDRSDLLGIVGVLVATVVLGGRDGDQIPFRDPDFDR